MSRFMVRALHGCSSADELRLPHATCGPAPAASQNDPGIAVKGLTLAYAAMTRRKCSCCVQYATEGTRTAPRKSHDKNRKPAHPPVKPATRLVTGGRDPFANHGFVNPPVYHASTVLYPHGRGLSRPPRPLSLWPARHADLGGARRRARGARRAGLRRRRAAAVGAGGGLDRAAVGARRPAIICWSPTASICRRANSATACSRASASPRPITIR